MSPTLMSPSKEAPVFCPLWKRASHDSRYIKSMALNRSTFYGQWSFSQRQVQTCFIWLENTRRKKGLQVTTTTTLWSTLWMVISFLIAKLRVMMVGSPEMTFFAKPTMKRQYQQLPYSRRMSMTNMLNLFTHPRPSPMPWLKTLAFKSLVHSNHVKIVP